MNEIGTEIKTFSFDYMLVPVFRIHMYVELLVSNLYICRYIGGGSSSISACEGPGSTKGSRERVDHGWVVLVDDRT